MHSFRMLQLFTALVVVTGFPIAVMAQTPEPTRLGAIEQEQAEKVKSLHPYELTAGERLMNKVEDLTVNGGLHWHQFLDSAYHGAGFTLGAGYMHHVSSYNLLDVRGSYSILGYKRVEAEFIAPRIFQRRGELSYSAATARRHRSPSTDSAPTARRTTGRTTCSRSRTCRGS